VTAHTPPPFVWTHHGLAKAEVSKFLRTQEPGKFEFDELLSVYVEAMLRSPGVNYVRDKAGPGALKDFVRDSDKIVHNVELKPAEYLRTHGNGDADGPRRSMGRVADAALRAVAKRKAERERKLVPPGIVLRREGVTTYLSPGPYQTNAQLLRGDGKLVRGGSKVSIRIASSSYDDEIGPNGSWKRGKIEDAGGDEPEKEVRNYADPARYGERPKGKEQRWAAGCLNLGVKGKSGQHPHYCDGIVEVYNPNPPRPGAVRPDVEAAAETPWAAPMGRVGRRTDWGIAFEPRYRRQRLRCSRDVQRLRDRPGLYRGPSWHKEAGYFDVGWGPLRPSFEEIFRGKDCSKRILTAPRATRWRPAKTDIAARWTNGTARRSLSLFIRRSSWLTLDTDRHALPPGLPEDRTQRHAAFPYLRRDTVTPTWSVSSVATAAAWLMRHAQVLKVGGMGRC